MEGEAMTKIERPACSALYGAQYCPIKEYCARHVEETVYNSDDQYSLDDCPEYGKYKPTKDKSLRDLLMSVYTTGYRDREIESDYDPGRWL